MAQLNKLADIPVRVIDSSTERGLTLARTLLHEVCTMLKTLLDTGEKGILDLRALPSLGEEGYRYLKENLGIGEVSAQIESFGCSKIQETAFPGIWWVSHYNQDGDILTELLEIDFFPEILKSRKEDMVIGGDKLDKLLKNIAEK